MAGGRDQRGIVKNGIQPQGRGRRWISILAVAGLVITVGIIAGTYWRLGKTNAPKLLPKPPELPRNVNQQLSGVTFTRSDKGQRLFVIHASRTLAFKQGGSTLLKDVYVEYFGKSGNRYDILKTAEGEYNPSTGNLSTPDDVELILNASPRQVQDLASKSGKPLDETSADTHGGRQPVYIRTSKVSSQDHGTLLESQTPVSFHLGAMSGAARGLAYSTDNGEIVLKQDVKAVFQPSQNRRTNPPIRLSASRLRYGGAGKGIELWGPLKIRQGNRIVTAEQGSISLDALNRVTEVLLEGQAHASDNTPSGRLSLESDVLRGHLDPVTSRLSKLVAAGHVRSESSQGGALTNLKAHEVVLNFSAATHVPANGVAMGQVDLTIAQLPGAGKVASGSYNLGGKISREDLATEKLQFSFRPEGKNLKEAETSGPGTLVLYPESAKAGDRTVTAAKFFMAFDSTSHLESLRGTGGTRIVFAPPPNSTNKAAVATAKQMAATFDPATEMVESVEQKGDFHFRNGNLIATGEEARDLARQQKLILTGHPEVQDLTTRARADRIVILLASDTAEGIGNVHAIHTDPRDPSLPTNVVADRMVADHRSEVVHYAGHVRAWRGTDVVESPTLDVYKNQRRVSTNSRVVTSHLQPAPSKASQGKASQSGPRPLTVRADRLDYFDAGRKARYSGNVELDTEGTRIEADQLDVYFSSGRKQADSEVKRAVAEGHVKVIQPMRYAKGEHAVYDARTGTIVMTGGPPTVYDAEKGFMSGQRLTFYIHNDRLLVDGNANSPTVSKHRVAQ